MAILRSAIQAAIKTQLDLVGTVENVYEDYRRAEDVSSFVDLYRETDESSIQTWLIHRKASPTRSEVTHRNAVEIGAIHFMHRFQVELFYAYKNVESEAVFQDLIDAVLLQFVDKRSLGGWSTEAPLGLITIEGDDLNGVVGQTALFEVTVVDPQRALTAT